MKNTIITFLATWFYSGLSPKAPGTMGSLAALPFGWWIGLQYGQTGLLIASLVAFLPGIWIAGAYADMKAIKDPSEVVIDEVAGQWLALAFLPISLPTLILGFLLFRLFDIWKPWPIGWLDQKTSGGFGIMIDDMVAGLFAGVLLYLIALTGWL